MKRRMLLVALGSMTGAVFAQEDVRKGDMRPKFDTHKPLGSDPAPNLPPPDPKDEFGYRVQPAPADYPSRGFRSQVDADRARQREWQRRRYQSDHPYQVNLSGDPYAREVRPTPTPTRRYGTSSTTPYSSAPYRPNNSSSYSRQYPKSDPNWLRPNFGSPQPRPAPTHPYSFNPPPAPQPTSGLYGTPSKRCGARSPNSFSPC